MDAQKEIRALPAALKAAISKGRPEFEALVRKTNWGTGPLFLLGSGADYSTALAGQRSFEELLGWPVIARRADNFAAYSESLIRPKTVVLAVSALGDSPETLEAARQARARGATLLALTASATSPLAESADGVFVARQAEEVPSLLVAETCAQVAIGFISLIAARVLKRHHQKLEDLENEFEKLPEDAELILTRFTDAVRSCAELLKGAPDLKLLGAGHYYPAALFAAHVLRSGAFPGAEALEPGEEVARTSDAAGEGATLFISGSRCRLKKNIFRCARQARSEGRKIVAVTDSNDRELSDLASAAVLLPLRTEIAGSRLGVVFLLALASQMSSRLYESFK